MDTLRAIVIKFIMITAVLWIVFGLFGYSFGEVLVSSVLLTGVSYIVGDRIILPRYGNVVATIADLALVFIMLWSLGNYLFEPLEGLFTVTLISTIIIGIGEALLHRYMEREVLDDEFIVSREYDSFRHSMQTEFGSEEDIQFDGRNMREEEKAWLEREKDDYYSD